MALRCTSIIVLALSMTACPLAAETDEAAARAPAPAVSVANGTAAVRQGNHTALTALRNGTALLSSERRGTKEDPRWAQVAKGNGSVGAEAGWAPPPVPHEKGYGFLATSTRYGTNPLTSCMMDSGALVAGTDYLAVATAQAMQNMFPDGRGACCYCGSGTGGGSTVALGCGTCARGRFIRQLPRGFHIWTPPDAEIFHKEFKLVVVDICPYHDNRMWCPQQVGHVNDFGVHNHFDFATPPPQFDNFYFAFEPMECEPQMQARIRGMTRCHP